MTFNDLPATLRAKIMSGVRWYLTREEYPLMVKYLRDTKAAVAGFDVEECLKLLTPPEGFAGARKALDIRCPIDFSQPAPYHNCRSALPDVDPWAVDPPRLERGDYRRATTWDKLRELFGTEFVAHIREPG